MRTARGLSRGDQATRAIREPLARLPGAFCACNGRVELLARDLAVVERRRQAAVAENPCRGNPRDGEAEKLRVAVLFRRVLPHAGLRDDLGARGDAIRAQRVLAAGARGPERDEGEAYVLVLRNRIGDSALQL